MIEIMSVEWWATAGVAGVVTSIVAFGVISGTTKSLRFLISTIS